jgi:hypothetical protein
VWLFRQLLLLVYLVDSSSLDVAITDVSIDQAYLVCLPVLMWLCRLLQLSKHTVPGLLVSLDVVGKATST